MGKRRSSHPLNGHITYWNCKLHCPARSLRPSRRPAQVVRKKDAACKEQELGIVSSLASANTPIHGEPQRTWTVPVTSCGDTTLQSRGARSTLDMSATCSAAPRASIHTWNGIIYDDAISGTNEWIERSTVSESSFSWTQREDGCVWSVLTTLTRDFRFP